jgi:phenylpyruvate tautomerase PptA (4-oxalocrotonate tautomerase family)
MPMLDAFIPDGALEPEAERKLLSKCTDLLLEHEGVDPTNERARAIAWVFLHRHEMYVGGAPADEPRYRFICQVPEGQYDEERRAAVTREMTQALVEAEGGKRDNPEARVWVFTYEVPDGSWGGLGQVFRLGDIAAVVTGERGREYAEQRLAERRRDEARAMLDAAGVETGSLA